MRKFLISFVALFMIGIWCVGMAVAATEAQKVAAIEDGLAYLAGTQQGDGSWDYWSGYYNQAATGAAIGAFVSQKSHWGTNTAAYQTRVDNAMNYLLQGATTQTLGLRGDGVSGCPGGAASCTGVYWYGNGETTYTTGLVASAIGQYAQGKAGLVATTSGPLAGMTWSQIAQGVVNMYAVGQSVGLPWNTGTRGGWRYFPTDNDADGSTTQWAVISMIYGQSLGATVPAIVKSELKNYWLANSAQDGSGGGVYQPGSGITDHSDTGSVLISHAFVGDALSNTQVQAALTWLNTNWKDTASGTWWGNFDHPYAMWADYKGLELYLGLDADTSVISNLHTDPGDIDNPNHGWNWWEDYNDWLVSKQNVDGSWTGYDYWTGNLATAFNISILGGTEIPDNPVPEPATMLLLGLGLIGLAGVRKIRK